jgi:hypothetical protein
VVPAVAKTLSSGEPMWRDIPVRERSKIPPYPYPEDRK